MRKPSPGFTYLWTLMALAVFGLSLAAVGLKWSQSIQREREKELKRVGVLYAQAIERYYFSTPGPVKQFPASLEALVQDPRFITPVRHLRRLYTDPMMPGEPFEIHRQADGKIVGVSSKSVSTPLTRVPWADGKYVVPVADRYCDWKFLAKVTG